MIRSDSIGLSAARVAVERLNAARGIEPDPLAPREGDVLAYFREMQQADQAIEHAFHEVRTGDLPPPEHAMLQRRRSSIDASVARQVFLLSRRLDTRHDESMRGLHAVFRMGSVPASPLEGRYRGQLVTTTVLSPLDSFGRIMSRLYMPWLGKRFHAESHTGDNVFKEGMRFWGHLYWPRYHGYRSYGRDMLTAFPFRTSIGPGVLDPDVQTLKLDYNDSRNPGFIVRDVLDELVQVTGNYYLGKAYIRRPGESYRLVAFFALQKEG
jgi:hypothetical protein